MGSDAEPTWGQQLLFLALSLMVLALAPVILVAIPIYCIVRIGLDLRSGDPDPKEVFLDCASLGANVIWLPLAIIAGAFVGLFDWASKLVREIRRYKLTDSRLHPEHEHSYWRRRRQVVDLEKLRPYKYPKLGGNHEIRLFELHPGGGHGREDVRGRIIRSNLLWGHSYDAISYTWADENGDSAKTEKIYLLDQRATLAVTRNCITVLKQLRHQKKRRLVWIDAICINQQSRLDRTHQVSLMARIYISAREVFAYTGEATEESDKLFDWMNSVHPKDLVLPTNSAWAGLFDIKGQAWAPGPAQLVAGLNDFWYRLSVLRHKASFSCSQWWSARFGNRPGQAPADHAVSLSDQQLMDTATEYFSRRWFQRVWVLQEVSLPDVRRVVIMCGAKSTSAIRALHSLSLLPSDDLGALTLGRFYLMLRKRIIRPGKSHLLDILIETRDRYCSEPRDKIFGVLSIASGLDENRFPELAANYNLSLARVYAFYSKFFIQEHGIVFFWSLIKSPRIVPNLPSWSADWSVPWPNYRAVRGRHLPAILRNNDRLGPSVSFESDFNTYTGRELLKVTLPTVVRGVFTRDGHLDGSDTRTRIVEDVGNLQEGHHLVELHPGICALIRERQVYHEFIQVCPHHLEVDGLHRVIDAWTEYVVDGKISELGDVAGGGEGHDYLSGLRTYYIR